LGKKEAYNFISSIWSDIFDLHIESAGETKVYDDYVVRGILSPENPTFSVVYLKGNVVVGYVAINRNPKEIIALNKLVEKSVDVSGKRELIANENFDLQKLVI